MSAIVRASYPVSFQLLNRDRQPILGIFDGQQGQTLKLEITNSSRRNMKPKQLAGQNATADNHHFELRFRPGTLVLPDSASPSRPAISVEEAGWKISDRPTVSDTGVSFYLLITNPTTIESGKSISVTLTNLSGDGKVGAHGTRVELKWNNNLEYVASAAGQAPEPLVPGHRLQHLSLVNESGQKHIPLHVGLVGNDKVLNNGTANELKLRITNLIKPDPLKPGEGNIELNPDLGPTKPPATKFTFSFDFSPIEPQRQENAWALGYLDEVRDIKLKDDKSLFNIQQPTLGQSPVWIITPAAQITLKPGQSLELRITEIKTKHVSGLTNLYIKYTNIPGYWDGNFVALIEKAPLVYKEQSVGVGIADPKADLHVSGNLRVDKEVSAKSLRLDKNSNILFEQNLQIKSADARHGILFRQTEDKLEFRERGQIIFSPGSEDKETHQVVIKSDGRVGIGFLPNEGKLDPVTHLHVAGPSDQEIMIQSTDENGRKWTLQSSRGADAEGRFEIVDRTAGKNRFTILKNGNVGIGTPDPQATLHVNGDVRVKEDKMIFFEDTGEIRSADTAHRILFRRQQNVMELREYGDIVFSPGSQPPNEGNETSKVIMFADGSVGIGYLWRPPGDRNRAKMRASLDINASVVTVAEKGYWFANYDGSSMDHTRQTYPYSIWATARIACQEFNAVSDARLKNIRGRSDSVTDLSTLLGIEITDYSHKDVITKGNGTYKKVIGQQIEKVFPQAVSRSTDVVPDIYQRASIQDGWIALATDLKKGDRVKLIAESGKEGLHEVLEVTGDKFRVDLEPEGEKIFVYGREVEDFLTVDYDAISMLNVSATQQLKKDMDHELKALRVENAELRAANNALATRLQLLESKVEAALGVSAAAVGSNGNGRH